MVGEFPDLQGVMGREYALLDGESPEVAQAMSRELADPRATHYWDAPLALGKDLVPILDVEPMQFAWDVYMFYDRDATWQGTPPAPDDWVHFMNLIQTEHYCPPTEIGPFLQGKAREMGLAGA